MWLLFSCCSFKMYQFVMLFGFAGPCFISFQVFPHPFRFVVFYCCSFCVTLTGDDSLEGGDSRVSLGSNKIQSSVYFHFLNSLVIGEEGINKDTTPHVQPSRFFWDRIMQKGFLKNPKLMGAQTTTVSTQHNFRNTQPQIKLSDLCLLFFAASFEAAGHFRRFSTASKKLPNTALGKSGSALPYDSAVYSLYEMRQII